MAWVDPTDVSAGSVLTASKWNQDVVANWNVFGAAWTAYTPTWTSLTVGNGTQDFAYIKVGRFVSVRGRLTWGSTTSASGNFTMSLPANCASAYPLLAPMGVGTATDGGAQLYSLIVVNDDDTRVNFTAEATNGTWAQQLYANATVPFTWASTDTLDVAFSYEAASA